MCLLSLDTSIPLNAETSRRTSSSHLNVADAHCSVSFRSLIVSFLTHAVYCHFWSLVERMFCEWFRRQARCLAQLLCYFVHYLPL